MDRFKSTIDRLQREYILYSLQRQGKLNKRHVEDEEEDMCAVNHQRLKR